MPLCVCLILYCMCEFVSVSLGTDDVSLSALVCLVMCVLENKKLGGCVPRTARLYPMGVCVCFDSEEQWTQQCLFVIDAAAC